ncbi:hypothetical protein [Paenibacillus sp. P32E]|uniref:hypothetical protein n=1 Tax=Paenibacillus sp. P32E TaxID=1349434 RepID=UPI00093B847F|nr:hypothetical protein [Paenibacillus sp. P32E]OKP93669.1 hypothetical protein A3848_03950 [Paenibacillus sp. P32E]
MTTWVDVTPNDWFYNEVMEASGIDLEDGNPMISGIEYGMFMADAPYLYEEQSGSEGKKQFTLSKKIVPTPANPLFVYVDGVQTVYKKVSNPSATSTLIEFYSAPRKGSIVSFVSQGKVLTDRFGRPQDPTSWSGFGHPKHVLDNGDDYVWDPFNRSYQEYCYAFGRPLKRIVIDEELWGVSVPSALVAKYLGNKTDSYMISPAPNACIYLPYNLNGVTCKFNYIVFKDGYYQLKGGEFKATAGMTWRNDRFFPNAYITRGEAFTLIDRVRKTLYSRFSDIDAPTAKLDQYMYAEEGQRRFRLNGTYPAGQGLLKVKRNGVLLTKDVNYQETDNHSITFVNPQPAGTTLYFYYEKKVSTRFLDVGTLTALYNNETKETITVDGRVPDGSWWAEPVLSMEGETFQDGRYLIEGYELSRFMNGNPVVDNMYTPMDAVAEGQKKPYFLPSTLLNRAQAVTFLNRFRKWCIERFK